MDGQFPFNVPRYNFGQRVYIEGDNNLCGIITAARLYGHVVSYTVEWIHNGCIQSATIEEFRLNAVLRNTL